MKGNMMRILMLVAVLAGGLWGCEETNNYGMQKHQDDDKPACGELAKTKECEK